MSSFACVVFRSNRENIIAQQAVSEISALYFDGRKDQTLIMSEYSSKDQSYFYRIAEAVLTGILANNLPSKMSHARWLTRANRILRLYVPSENASANLITLTTYIVKDYTRVVPYKNSTQL